MRTLLLISFFFASFLPIKGQYANDLTPKISSDNSISERVAYTEITIEYGSPKVRGRAIWGEMEEYGQIWRAGANKATRISFSEDVQIEGKKLASGVYSFFVIPKENEAWTLIFNKVADQWGAFGYEASQDALRIDVMPQMNTHVEDLTFDIIAKDFEGAFVTLEWEEIKLSFFVEVDHLFILESILEEKLAQLPGNIHWVVYLQAATYLVDQNQRLEKAEEWLNKSEELYDPEGEWSGQYYPKDYIYGDLLWAKAKLAALNENFKEALEFAQQMKDIQGAYTFYEKEGEAEQIDFRMQEWKKLVK
jgi:hypothetical protein